MVTSRVANRKAGEYVQSRRDFTGSNTRGSSLTKVIVTHKDAKWHEDGNYYVNKLYVVYTYNTVLFVYDPDAGVWFENTTRYSATSSKHRSQLHPKTNTIQMDRHDISELVMAGSYREFIRERVRG